VNSTAQNQAIDGLLLQYPDNPALGSPFGTGNETFGRPAALKRGAAMAGDMLFQSQVRAWLGATSRCGVKVYGYHFTDPQLSGPFGGSLAFPIHYYTTILLISRIVHHAAELPYIFGPTPGLTTFPTPPGLSTLSPIMQDYWLSFVSTLNPNDGKGSTRSSNRNSRPLLELTPLAFVGPTWPLYTQPGLQRLELKSSGIVPVKDDFRKDQIAYITANSQAFFNR
jgi:acetylcholinesterase